MSESDCIDLGSLLQKGYPLSHALLIVDKKYQNILEKLDQGESILHIFSQQKSFFFQTICLFARFTSLSQSIQAASDLKQLKQSLQKQVITQCSYPTLILIFAIIVFILFEGFIYPQISLLIETENMMFHLLLFKFLKLIMVIVILLIICIDGIFLYLYTHPEKKKNYFQKYLLRLNLIKKLISYQFATYLVTLMKQGFSTQQIIESLSQCEINQVMNWVLDDMIKEFEKGNSWISIMENSIYFHDKLIYFFKMGFHLSELTATLLDYIEFQKQNFTYLVKQFSTMITILSYGSIACLVITIYQVILLPLEMIERM